MSVMNYNLSLSDIVNCDILKDTVNPLAPENKEKLKAALYRFGMRIDKHVQIMTCKHRNVDGKVVYCELFMGTERSDEIWKGIKYRAIGR